MSEQLSEKHSHEKADVYPLEAIQPALLVAVTETHTHTHTFTGG